MIKNYPAACRENAAMEKSVTQETSVPVIGQRFRGFLPVVVDVETAGLMLNRCIARNCVHSNCV